jgi:hypothetical protein
MSWTTPAAYGKTRYFGKSIHRIREKLYYCKANWAIFEYKPKYFLQSSFLNLFFIKSYSVKVKYLLGLPL